MTKLNGTTELLPSKSKVPIDREKEKLNTVKKKRSFLIYKMLTESCIDSLPSIHS